MNNSIYTGIDIGSKNLKLMSIAYNAENNTTKILHKKSYSSKGVTDGYISNPDLFNQTFLLAIKNYTKETGIIIEDIILTIDSYGLKSQTLTITHNVANQSHITDVDIDEIKRKINIIAHREIKGEIIESKLIKYTINDYEYFSDIEGLQAKKIEAEFIFIFLPKNHLSILEKILIKNDISLLDLKSGNLVSAEINLDKEDKSLGILNIDIGADNTSLSIWENNKPIFLDNIKYGSDDITKTISFEKKISFNEAENLKENTKGDKKIEKLIQNSYKELSKKIKIILKDFGKEKLFPAGALLYGGGSKNKFAIDVLKEELSLPIKSYSKNISDNNTDYHNIYAGIVLYILNEKENKIFNLSNWSKPFKKIFSNFKKL